MPVTRRSLVRNLATLSALPAFSGIGSRLAFASLAPPPKATIDPNSIYILFEGPWIIDQPTSSSIRATTFGNLGPVTHSCAVGLSDPKGYDLGNPTDVSGVALPLDLGIGENWTVSPVVDPSSTSSTPGLVSPLTSLTQGFDAAHVWDSFLYVKDSSQVTGERMQVAPNLGQYRTVTLPMPTNVFIGGIMVNTAVAGDKVALASQKDQPHCVVILQYQYPKGTTVPVLQLSPQGRSTVPLSVTNHLAFRMTHQPDDGQKPTEISHAKLALAQLASMIWDGTTTLPLSFTTICDTAVSMGQNPGGFGLNEMGLSQETMQMGHCPTGHRCIKSGGSLGDCCGGGIVFGG